MPGQDLRTRGWAPAEPLQAFLHAVERLTEMQGPRNHTVLMCAAQCSDQSPSSRIATLITTPMRVLHGSALLSEMLYCATDTVMCSVEKGANAHHL